MNTTDKNKDELLAENIQLKAILNAVGEDSLKYNLMKYLVDDLANNVETNVFFSNLLTQVIAFTGGTIALVYNTHTRNSRWKKYQLSKDKTKTERIIIDDKEQPFYSHVIKCGYIFFCPRFPELETISYELMNLFPFKDTLNYFLLPISDSCDIFIESKNITFPKYVSRYDSEIRNFLFPMILRIKQTIFQEELNQERMFFSSVVSNIIDGVVVTDPQGKIIFVNEPLSRITNYTAQELYELSDISNLLLGKQFVTHILESLKNGKPIRNFETTVLPQKSSTIPIELSVVNIKENNSILFIIHDLRNLVSLNEEIMRLRRFSVDFIKASLFVHTTIGPTVLITEDLPFLQNQKSHSIEQFLLKVGIFYGTTLGQGNERNEGLFGPFPVPSIADYEGLAYSFLMVNPDNKDVRDKGKSYCFIVFFLPKSLDKLLTDRSTISAMIDKKIANLRSLRDFTVDFLQSLKNHILDVPYEEPISVLIINQSGLSLFTHQFQSKTDYDYQLLSGFIMALNSLSQEMFAVSGDIKQITHHNYSILISKYKSLLICYVFRGQSYSVEEKLQLFANSFKKAEETIPNFNYTGIHGFPESFTNKLVEITEYIFSSLIIDETKLERILESMTVNESKNA